VFRKNRAKAAALGLPSALVLDPALSALGGLSISSVAWALGSLGIESMDAVPRLAHAHAVLPLAAAAAAASAALAGLAAVTAAARRAAYPRPEDVEAAPRLAWAWEEALGEGAAAAGAAGAGAGAVLESGATAAAMEGPQQPLLLQLSPTAPAAAAGTRLRRAATTLLHQALSRAPSVAADARGGHGESEAGGFWSLLGIGGQPHRRRQPPSAAGNGALEPPLHSSMQLPDGHGAGEEREQEEWGAGGGPGDDALAARAVAVLRVVGIDYVCRPAGPALAASLAEAPQLPSPHPQAGHGGLA